MPDKKFFLYSGEKAEHAVLFLLCFFPLAASLFITTDGNFSTFHFFSFSKVINNVCVFKLVTGYRCPVCGMTRCFAYMSHGDINGAWRMSHAGVGVYFLCVYECIYRLLRIFTRIPFLKIFKTAEAVFLAAAGTATLFFFVIQFFCPRIAYGFLV